MRAVVICILAIAATACASTSAPAPETAAVSATSTEKADKLTAEKLMAAQTAGYEIKDVDGKKLFCRREMQTGSHTRYKTSCLTEREWEQLAQATRQNVQDMSRKRLPPRSN